MPSVKYTEEAEADLNEIIDHTLQRWDEQQAIKYLDGLESVARSLAETPNIGKPCDELFKGLRGFPYQSHVIYYRKAPRGITIVRVLHEHMNPSLYLP